MSTNSLQAKLILCAASTALVAILSARPTAGSPPADAGVSAASASKEPELFATAEQAANAMVNAAEQFNVPALLKLVGEDGEDLVLTGEFAQDRERAQEFAAQARKQLHVSVDAKTKSRGYLLVGEEDWPFAIPLVKHSGGWSFDAAAGREELFNRRIGSNELDAIEVCRGFVEAQNEYAFRTREGYEPAEYAQRIIAAPGHQDALAWQSVDGAWEGPIGEEIAHAIEQGYKVNGEPYRGYFFKVLKGQGPAAPMGTMDFVVNGVMIGGFALVAAPAEYGLTGLKTFMVSHMGVVYEKDFGVATLDEFQKMERFNPDKSWAVVPD